MYKKVEDRIEAAKKYNKENYTHLTFRVRKDEAEKIKEAANNNGVSVNSFILAAVKDKL